MMHEPTDMTERTEQPEPEPEPEPERLMTRLVDGEASVGDRARFETLADEERGLWRDLALRQLEMGLLARRVAGHTAGADRIELPPRRSWTTLSVTLSGWAALLVLGLLWVTFAGEAVPATNGSRPVPAAGEAVPHRVLTPQEHLQAYLQAEHVLGELAPVLLDTDDLGDGTLRLRYLRRIEEHIVIDEPLEHYVDEAGRLVVDPPKKE